MLPRITIGPDLGGRPSLRSATSSRPATSSENRVKKPVRATNGLAPSRPHAATSRQSGSVAPTRKSLEGIKAIDSSLQDLALQSSLYGDSTSSSDTASPAHSEATVATATAGTSDALRKVASSASISSEAELTLLLGGSDVAPTTVINVGSIPLFVPLACVDVPAAPAAVAVPESSNDDVPAEGGNSASSSLDAGSAEFYPPAYLAAAAAATALAAASASSAASSRTSSSQRLGPAEAEEAAADKQDEQQQQHDPAAEAAAAAAAAAAAWQQQQMYWQHQHQAAAGGAMMWPQHQQQQWHTMQQMAGPMFFPFPYSYMYAVPLPHYMHYQQHYLQQHQQLMPAASDAADEGEHHGPAADAAASVPPSPCASIHTEAGWPGTPAADSASTTYYYTSRPGSSTSSVHSGYRYRSTSSTSGSTASYHVPRDVSTVSVTPVSSVKDAAGALAKVVSRSGTGVLLALARAGDQAAQVTHVAAKSLAVARFYVNSHMSAEGSAGVEAAAALTGLEPPTPEAAVVAAVEDEVVFMPYFRAGSSAGVPEPAISFLVAKAAASDLPSHLPAPVGIPACMQDKQQQQHQVAAASSSGRGPLLRAGMSTDINKLSNAIIHNVLASGHVALQLAGAAACQIAMKALIKASSRLQRKFAADVVATASFANVDTNSSIGRSTVFLRVDVMRSSLLQQLAAAAGGQQAGPGRHVAEAFAAVVDSQRPQQLQPAAEY